MERDFMFDYKLIPSTIKDYVKNLNYTKDNLVRSGYIVLNFD